MVYTDCLPFEAASAQGTEREKKYSDKGSCSAVGANARSTDSLFMLAMNIEVAALLGL